MTTNSDNADKWAVPQVVEDKDAEKSGAAPKLQEFLQHQATVAFCEQAAKM